MMQYFHSFETIKILSICHMNQKTIDRKKKRQNDNNNNNDEYENKIKI